MGRESHACLAPGFIVPDDGSADVFAHYTAIASGGWRSLDENQKVQFEIVQGPKGPQAENIRRLDRDSALAAIVDVQQLLQNLVARTAPYFV